MSWPAAMPPSPRSARPASATRRARAPDGGVGGPFADRLPPLPRRLTAVAAAAVVTAGVTAAAYTQALPGPDARSRTPSSRRLASPASTVRPPGPGTSSAASPRHQAGRPKRPRRGRGTTTGSRWPPPVRGARRHSGRVHRPGHRGRGAAARVRVRLFERLAGINHVQLVATGVTGPRGGFRLESPPLTATAVFRVVGPDAAHSVAVRVAVAPGPASQGGGYRRRDRGEAGPRDDDEHEPRDPRRAAGADADDHPKGDQQRAARRARRPRGSQRRQ